MKIVLTSYYDRKNGQIINVTKDTPLPVVGAVVNSTMVPIQVPDNEESFTLNSTTPSQQVDLYSVSPTGSAKLLRGITLIASQACSVRLSLFDGTNNTVLTGWLPLVEGAGWVQQFETMLRLEPGMTLRLTVQRYARPGGSTSVTGLYLGGYLLVRDV